MAGTSSSTLDKWRDYFRSANADIFEIIEHGIMVAASDCPYDFKSKRDRIAEVLFSCKITKCSGCDRLELAVPNNGGGGGGEGLEKSEDKYKSGVEANGSKDTKESKANSSSRDDNVDDDDDDDEGDDDDGGDRGEVMVMEMNAANRGSNGNSYVDVEALNDEIEEESQFFGEVLRIKGVLDNYEEESDSTLFDSLRRLQLMPLSVETLKATEIGKTVNALRKHGSKEIRNLVRTLIEDWKIMVDSWVDATKAIAGAQIRTESVKTSVLEEEEGLPSPPLDEGVFFATPTSMELSQFFDGMDDDGNPRNSGELNKNRGSGRSRPTTVEKTDAPKLKNRGPHEFRALPKDRKAELKRSPEAVLKRQAPPKPNGPPGGEHGALKPSNYDSGPGRPKPVLRPNYQQKFDKDEIQKKPLLSQQDKLNHNNENSVRMNLEAAKRKLHERYQEAEKAKKQRTIQVVELRDLPKKNVAQRNQQARPGNHNRNWANPNGRR